MDQRNIFEDRSTGFDVFVLLTKRIREAVPTSLIRLGDGEGAVMGYPELTGRKEIDRSWNNWIGDTNVSEQELLELSEGVRYAIANSDVIGLPRRKQANSFYLYQKVLDTVIQYDLLNEAQLKTDTAIHRFLQFGLFYRPLLKGLDFLGVISSRSINEKLKSVFGVKNITHYKVRGQSAFPGSEKMRHFPDGFRKIQEELVVPYQGAVFLVGAGAFGKIYCQWIKERRGIAIDIGSIFEPWAKVSSRTTHSCHHMEVYDEFPIIDRETAKKRYNDLCDEFEMDTPRIDSASEVLNYLPSQW